MGYLYRQKKIKIYTILIFKNKSIKNSKSLNGTKLPNLISILIPYESRLNSTSKYFEIRCLHKLNIFNLFWLNLLIERENYWFEVKQRTTISAGENIIGAPKKRNNYGAIKLLVHIVIVILDFYLLLHVIALFVWSWFFPLFLFLSLKGDSDKFSFKFRYRL